LVPIAAIYLARQFAATNRKLKQAKAEADRAREAAEAASQALAVKNTQLEVAHQHTEEARAELEKQVAERQKAEALYHSVVNNIPQYLFRKDREGRFTFA
jgi:PAS domain-containing protein